MRSIFFIGWFLFCSAALKAQDTDEMPQGAEDAPVEGLAFSEMAADSATITHDIRQTEFIPGDDDPAIIEDRIHCIEGIVPLHYNERIHSFVNYFTVKNRDYTTMVAQRASLYFPIFDRYLEKYNLPEELKYLSIIESGLNPKATSRARAVGLWQFVSATGRYYGLKNNWYIDERMDPEKSTDAACRYLRDLYSMFGNWELAIAAYNTGPGNVKKAIRRSGYKKSFWEIYPFLARETRSYLPQFVAIIYTMHYLDEHNFYDIASEILPVSDTVTIDGYVHLETFARLTGTCMEDIRRLNPAILRSALPDGFHSYPLNIPVKSKLILDDDRVAILDSAGSVGRLDFETLAKNASDNTYGKDRIVYRVKYGDVLGGIALRHHVSINDIREWNNLHSNVIRTGQSLTVWVRPGTPPPALSTSTPVSTSTTLAPQQSSQVIPLSSTYIVQPGDTLWDISRKFEGLTIEKIKTMNNLNSNSIHPGQTLIIGI